MPMEMTLQQLDRLVGNWTTEATHPAAPGLVVRGTVVTEWLEGKQFLIHRSRNDHPDFPDAISIVGATDRDRIGEAAPEPAQPSLTMHYFDSRGVFRVYQVDMEADTNVFTIWREAPGFSQRFRGTFVDADSGIQGLWQVCEDGSHWHDDLQINYRRS